MFNAIRIALLLIISIFIILIIKKSNIVNKRIAAAVSLTVCFVVITVSGMFPVENIFTEFKSPENVFNYMCNGKIDDIVYGKQSCMIIYSDYNKTISHLIIPKNEKGYKIPSYFYSKKVFHKFDRSGNFDIYTMKGTDDYYLLGNTLSDESEQIIVDSNGKQINFTAYNMGDTDTKTVILYSYVENFTSDYYLIFNGEKITLTESCPASQKEV